MMRILRKSLAVNSSLALVASLLLSIAMAVPADAASVCMGTCALIDLGGEAAAPAGPGGPSSGPVAGPSRGPRRGPNGGRERRRMMATPRGAPRPARPVPPPPPPRPPSVIEIVRSIGVAPPTITITPNAPGLTGLEAEMVASNAAPVNITGRSVRGLTMAGTLVPTVTWTIKDGAKTETRIGPTVDYNYRTKGTSQITAKVTWRCSGCTAEGAVPQAVPAGNVVLNDVTTYAVREARSVLK